MVPSRPILSRYTTKPRSDGAHKIALSPALVGPHDVAADRDEGHAVGLDRRVRVERHGVVHPAPHHHTAVEEYGWACRIVEVAGEKDGLAARIPVGVRG